MLLNLAQRLSCTKSKITAPLLLKKSHHLQKLINLNLQSRIQCSQSKLKIMTMNMIKKQP